MFASSSHHNYKNDNMTLTKTANYHQSLDQRLTDQRNALGGRHALRHHHLKHGERQQNCHAQRNLLARVGGQVEAQRCQEGDEETGQQQVKDVERAPPLQ